LALKILFSDVCVFSEDAKEIVCLCALDQQIRRAE